MANANPVDGVFSFDVIINKAVGLVIRVYHPALVDEAHLGIVELERSLNATEVVPMIIFYHGGSFAHSSCNSAIYDTLCLWLIGICGPVVVSVKYHHALENGYEDDQLKEGRAWMKTMRLKEGKGFDEDDESE
ncbi:gibberellin receptor GID1A-like [Macadamia integrifolia]|uniref:gibberellin receptor GID1A-like n=1 Tax=Macadamia integrifolia TaxID=60698 RepID=UPI001C527B9E|nr:gibberellin receptor GID1A-like [Macadamia integrifolia]